MSTAIIFDTSALFNLTNFILKPKYVKKQAGEENLEIQGEHTANLFVKKDKLPHAHRFLVEQYKNPHLVFEPHLTGLVLIEALGKLGLSVVIPENVMIETFDRNTKFEETNYYHSNKVAFYNSFLEPFTNAEGKFNVGKFQQFVISDIDKEKPFFPASFDKIEEIAMQQFNFGKYFIPLLKDQETMIKPISPVNNSLSLLINQALMCLYKGADFATSSNNNFVSKVRGIFNEVSNLNGNKIGVFFKKIANITPDKIDYGELGVRETIGHYLDKSVGLVHVITDDIAFVKKVREQYDKNSVNFVCSRHILYAMNENNLMGSLGIKIDPLHYDKLLGRNGFKEEKFGVNYEEKEKPSYKKFAQLINKVVKANYTGLL